MKLPPILALAVCLAMLGCDQDSIAPSAELHDSVESEITPQQANGPKERRFSASMTYEGISVGDAGSCTVLSRSSTAYPAEFEMDGQASHLGRITGTIKCCKQMPNYVGATNLTGILTTSSGQELWFKCDWLGHYYNDEQLNMAIYKGNAVIVGGTGRFENASGSFRMLVGQNLSQPEGIYIGDAEFDGTIVY